MPRPAPENGVERLFCAMRPTAGCSRSRTASTACASAMRAGGSAMRATPSTRIRVQTCARGRRPGTCVSRCRSPRSAAVAAAHFSRTGGHRQGQARLHRGARRRVRHHRLRVPDNDLAIQWDCSTEVQDAYGAVPGYSAEGAISATSTSSPRCPRASARASSSATTSARHARRLAALRARGSSATVASPTPRSRHPAGASTGSHSGASRREGNVFRAVERLETAGAQVYPGVIHNIGRRQGAHGLARKVCRNSGSRPIAVSAACRRPRCRRCSTTIFRPSRPRANYRA